jgi:hypothetical protein
MGGGVNPVEYLYLGPFKNSVAVALRYGSISVLGNPDAGPAETDRSVPIHTALSSLRTRSVVISQVLAVFVLLKLRFCEYITKRAEFPKDLCLETTQVSTSSES